MLRHNHDLGTQCCRSTSARAVGPLGDATALRLPVREPQYDVIGMGQAMVDFSCTVEDNVVDGLGVTKSERRYGTHVVSSSHQTRWAMKVCFEPGLAKRYSFPGLLEHCDEGECIMRTSCVLGMFCRRSLLWRCSHSKVFWSGGVSVEGGGKRKIHLQTRTRAHLC
jgi:hypothetical protein